LAGPDDQTHLRGVRKIGLSWLMVTLLVGASSQKGL
jgi:hypothetical protein